MDDIQRINDLLDQYPLKIYNATTRTEDLRQKWLIADARKDYVIAGAYLRCKTKDMTEGEAKNTAIAETLDETTSVIIAESAYRRALADQVRLENEFTSIRKQAELLKITEQHIGRGT